MVYSLGDSPDIGANFRQVALIFKAMDATDQLPSTLLYR